MLITEELAERPSREPDYAVESRALVDLADAMRDPQMILQKLVETTMEMCGAESAGVSILDPSENGDVFRWHAIAGEYAVNADQVIPRSASPCGVAMDRDAVLLFRLPERHFRALAGAEPAIAESLLAPFYCDGTAVGTLWAVTHGDERRFDAEDARLLGSLSRFASAAYHLLRARDDAVTGQRQLEERVSERAAELARTNSALRREIGERSRAEGALRRSQERLRLALDTAPMGTWSMDLESGIPDIDEGFRDLFGIQDVANSELYDVIERRIHPDDLERLHQRIGDAIHAEDVGNCSIEHRAFRHDGSVMHLLTTARAYFDGEEAGEGAARRPVRVVGTVLDITERKQHELVLQKRENRLKRALGIGTVGIIFFKADGSVTWANNAFLRMSGYSRGDLEGGRVRWETMTPPEWMPQSLNAIKEFQTSGHTVPYEKEYIRKDGSRWWGLFAATSVSDEEGVEYILDITERNQTAERLRASEERFRAILNQATVAVAQADLDRQIMFANERAAEIVGLTDGHELIGRELLEFAHPDDRDEHRSMYQRLTPEGIPFEYERRIVRTDGSIRWANIGVSPIRDADGIVRSAVVLAIDTTERKQAEESLQESETRFRTVANLVPDLLWRNDPNGHTDWYNQRWFDYTGKTPETAESGWADVIHPDDRDRSRMEFLEAVRSGTPLTREHRIRRADGEYRWFLLRAEPVRDESGRIVHWFGTATDVQDQHLRRQELEQQVQEATAELRSLSRKLLKVQEAERHHLAHELHDEIGQALTGLNFSLEMARRHTPIEHLDHASEITEHLAEQVRALSLELRPPVLDDMGLIPALLALAERFPAHAGVRVDLYHEDADRRFPSDVETVAYRVVQEALTNVARHSEAEYATVRVLANSTLTVWINDEGAGFDIDAVRSLGGTSGLAGMEERASLVGGTLEIESEPGRGATIILELPLDQGSDQTSEVNDDTYHARR